MKTQLPSSEAETMDWLPRIKLAPNVLDDNFLVRQRVLVALHNAICKYRLTVLSTPPGYGKSALLNLWLQANSGMAHTDRAMQSAYLSLDAAENDRMHFLLALIAALQTLHPACGQRAQSLLTQSGYPESVDAVTQTQILTGLIVVDVARYLPNGFVLILDNYEQISEPCVHSALNYLVRRLPSQARVIISTTQNPPLSLTKLSAHGLATILRAETLAFDEFESNAFLDKVVELHLPATQKLTLHRFVEGWPAGLYLLAQDLHALSHEGARIRFINALNDGHKPSVNWPVMDAYLREEVFDELPTQLRTFLMRSSILSTLNAEVCKAVTSCQDAAELLYVTYQRNLFLFRQESPQDEAGAVELSQPHFRFHTLFAAFLRGRLYQEMPDEVAQLHQRAAAAASEPAQKIRHYLAAQFWTEATQLLVSTNTGDLSGEMIAKLIHNTSKMPRALRQAFTAQHKAVPPAAMRFGLTARQFEVLSLLGRGASNHAIATELLIALPTVKGHISEIMRKLEVHTRREAVLRATELGLLLR